MNPNLVENQMTGELVMAASRGFSEGSGSNDRVTSLDWVTYPIMRFKDHPNVTAIVVQRTDQISAGAATMRRLTSPAAIANAFFDATGVRIREAPMTPAASARR